MKFSSLSILQQKILLFLAIIVLAIAGCARTSAVNYYQLTAMNGEHTDAAGIGAGETVIGIGPVRLPEYLDRPQMLVRESPNRLELADSHRWVEPLTENLSRVLRENLASLLDTERLLLYPWDRSLPVTCQLVVDIVRFEGEGYRKGVLEAVWTIRDQEGKTVLPPRRSTFAVATRSADHQGLATALSESLFLLCREVVQEMSRQLQSVDVTRQEG